MASSPQFELQIATIDASLFDGPVVSVTVPGSEGYLTVLAHHEAFISLLGQGTITVRTATEEVTFTIDKGMLEVSNDTATILI